MIPVKDILFNILILLLLVVASPIIIPIAMLIWVLWTFHNPESKE